MVYLRKEKAIPSSSYLSSASGPALLLFSTKDEDHGYPPTSQNLNVDNHSSSRCTQATVDGEQDKFECVGRHLHKCQQENPHDCSFSLIRGMKL